MQIKTVGIAVCLLSVAGIWASVRAQTSTPVAPHQWVAAPAEPYSLPAGTAGRYLIITASIDSVINGPPKENGERVPDRTVIRIDTQTGRAWRLVELGDSSGQTTLSWMPIHEATLKGN